MTVLNLLMACALVSDDDHAARQDFDGDGYRATQFGGTDCDDLSSAIHPGAFESCNGVDDDCNGLVDDGAGEELWYVDADGDGYGAGAGETACEQPQGTSDVDGDCDDEDPAINPSAEELWYDGVDADCDEADDYDADGDGYNTLGEGDCDDADPGINPGAEDSWYDGVDTDCDGWSDYDADRDGYDSADHEGDDCDDTAPAVNPGAEEVCNNGIDDDCDGAGTGCDLSGELGLELAYARMLGQSSGSNIVSLAGAGDVNGDGVGDVVLGTRYDSSGGYNSGAAFVVFGPVSGELELEESASKLVGEETNDQAGLVVRGLPDMDLDGNDEVLVMAKGPGLAYVVKGPVSADVDLSGADARLSVSPSTPRGPGHVSTGDFDGDGAGDVVLGTSSVVYLFHGPFTGDVGLGDVHATLTGTSQSLAAAGDVNGDGHEDLVLGNSQLVSSVAGAGGAYIKYGPLSTSDLDADVVLTGELPSSYTGSNWDDSGVTAAGDVNADGYDDVLIPSQGAEQRGTVFVVYGPATSGSLSDAGGRVDGLVGGDTSPHGYGDLAMVPAGPGDLDGDGNADVVVGAPYTQWVDDGEGSEAPLGAAYLFLGPVTGTHDLDTSYGQLVGEEISTNTGMLLWAAGDVTGDGNADLLVGDYLTNGGSRGVAYVVAGGGGL